MIIAIIEEEGRLRSNHGETMAEKKCIRNNVDHLIYHLDSFILLKNASTLLD